MGLSHSSGCTNTIPARNLATLHALAHFKPASATRKLEIRLAKLKLGWPASNLAAGFQAGAGFQSGNNIYATGAKVVKLTILGGLVIVLEAHMLPMAL